MMKGKEENVENLKSLLADYFAPLVNYRCFESSNRCGLLNEPLWRYRQFALENKQTMEGLKRCCARSDQIDSDWLFIGKLVLSIQKTAELDTENIWSFSQLKPAEQIRLLKLSGFVFESYSSNSEGKRGVVDGKLPESFHSDGGITALLSYYALSISITGFLREENQDSRNFAIGLLKAKSKDINRISFRSLNLIATFTSYFSLLDLGGTYIEFAHSNLIGLDLSNCDFSGQHLFKIKADHTRAQNCRFHFSCLKNASLVSAELNSSDFTGAELSYANLGFAQCGRTIWNYANLSNASLREVIGNGARFEKTNLYKTVLSQARFMNASFKDAYFDGTIVDNDIDFGGVIFSSLGDLQDYCVLNESEIKLTDQSVIGYLQGYCLERAKKLERKENPFGEFKHSGPAHFSVSRNAVEVQRDIVRKANVLGSTERSPFWPEGSAWHEQWHTHILKQSLSLAKITTISNLNNPLFSALSYLVHQSSEAKQCRSSVSVTRLKRAIAGEEPSKLFENLWYELKHSPGHDNYPGRISIHKIEAVRNLTLWREYQKCKAEIKKKLQENSPTLQPDPLRYISWHIGGSTGQLPVLDREAGECWLFHATSTLEVMQSIIEKGFDTSHYRGNGKLGKGIYLTDAFGLSATYNTGRIPCCAEAVNQKPCQCHEDKKDVKVMFLVRATLGNVLIQDRKRDKKAERLPEGFDAIWARDGTLREMDNDFHCNEFLVNHTISFGSSKEKSEPVYQLYPEWCIYYKEHRLLEPSFSSSLTQAFYAPTVTPSHSALRDACEHLCNYERIKIYATDLEIEWAKERFLRALHDCERFISRAEFTPDEEDLHGELDRYGAMIRGRIIGIDKNMDLLPEIVVAGLWIDGYAQQARNGSVDSSLAIKYFDKIFYSQLCSLKDSPQSELSQEWLAHLCLQVGVAKHTNYDIKSSLELINWAWWIASSYVERIFSLNCFSFFHGMMNKYTEETYYETSLKYLKKQLRDENTHNAWCERVAGWLAQKAVSELRVSSFQEVISAYEKHWETHVQSLSTNDQTIFVNVFIRTIECDDLQKSRNKTRIFTPEIRNLLRQMAQQLPDSAGNCLAIQQARSEWEALFENSVVQAGESEVGSATDKRIWWLGKQNAENVEQGMLSSHIANQLFEQGESSNFATATRAANMDSRRLVIELTQSQFHSDSDPFAFAKIFPEFPGKQLAVDLLLERLTGYSALGTLCTFNFANTSIRNQPVYISKSAGVALQEIKDWKMLEEKLDPYYFTLKMIATLLLSLEDDKKDNICQEKTLTDQFRLTSIDADRAFVRDFNEKKKVNLKTVLFCFSAMKKPLNQRAVKRFLRLSPTDTLREWLNSLITYQKKIDELFSKKVQEQLEKGIQNKEAFKTFLFKTQKNQELYSFVSIAFSPDSMHRLLQRWRWIHRWLAYSNNQEKSHQALLEAISPRLAICYAPYQIDIDDNNPAIRFDQFCEKYTDYKTIGSSNVAGDTLHQSDIQTKDYIQQTQITPVDFERYQVLKSLTITTQNDFLYKDKVDRPCYPRDALTFLNQGIDFFQSQETLMHLWEEKKYDYFIEEVGRVSCVYDLPQRLMSRIDARALDERRQGELLKRLLNTQFFVLILRGFTLNKRTLELIKQLIKNQRELNKIKILHGRASESIQSNSLNTFFLNLLMSPTIEKVSIKHFTKMDEEPFKISDKKKIQKQPRDENSTLISLELCDIPDLLCIGSPYPLYLPHLKYLTVDNHDNCYLINIESPELTHANIRKNSRLDSIQLNGARLNSLDISGCERFTNDALDEMVEFCQTVLHLNVSNTHVTKPKYKFSHLNISPTSVQDEIPFPPPKKSKRSRSRFFRSPISLTPQEKKKMSNSSIVNFDHTLDVHISDKESSTTMNSEYDYLYKLMLIGDSNVKKISFMLTFADDTYRKSYTSTIDVDFKVKTIVLDGAIIKLEIWDTPGQERFRTTTNSFYRGVHGVLVMFDITDQVSYNEAKQSLKEIECYACENVAKILVGDNCDLEDKRQIAYETAKEFADHIRVPYIETSAKNATNIAEAFIEITRQIRGDISTKNIRCARLVIVVTAQVVYSPSEAVEKFL